MFGLKNNNKTAIIAAANSGKRGSLFCLSFSASAHRHMPLGNNVMWRESLCGLVLRLIHLTRAAGGHLVNPPTHTHTWKRWTTPAHHHPTVQSPLQEILLHIIISQNTQTQISLLAKENLESQNIVKVTNFGFFLQGRLYQQKVKFV